MAVALPFIMMGLSAAGAARSGMDKSQALAQDAGAYAAEGRTASAQGYEAESMQRRTGALALGRMTAAAGQSGGGYQGSTGAVINQSAENAEHDALSVRYKAQLQKWAYASQSANLSQASSNAGTSGVVNTGAALLKGFSNTYTGGDDLG